MQPWGACWWDLLPRLQRKHTAEMLNIDRGAGELSPSLRIPLWVEPEWKKCLDSQRNPRIPSAGAMWKILIIRQCLWNMALREWIALLKCMCLSSLKAETGCTDHTLKLYTVSYLKTIRQRSIECLVPDYDFGKIKAFVSRLLYVCLLTRDALLLPAWCWRELGYRLLTMSVSLKTRNFIILNMVDLIRMSRRRERNSGKTRTLFRSWNFFLRQRNCLISHLV